MKASVSIDTCSTSWNGELAVDSRVHVYTEDGPPAELAGLSLLGIADDGCPGPNSLLSHAYLYVTNGTEYWIRLANNSDAFGYDYKLRLRQVGAPETTADPYIYPTSDQLLVTLQAQAALKAQGDQEGQEAQGNGHRAFS